VKPRPRLLPPLETDRLRLRPMRADDADALFAIYGDAEVMRYAGDGPFPDVSLVTSMLASVERLLADGVSLEWAVVEKAGDKLIGTCGLHSFDDAAGTAEVGCLLARAAWGRGVMSEALPAVFAFGRDALGVTRLLADIDAPNTRSIRLFTRLGFVPLRDTLYTLDLTPPATP
jgi:RimJ/RimL family protein N-acetyltransferase